MLSSYFEKERPNALGGTTKTIQDFKKNVFVDSVFDDRNKIKKVVAYFDSTGKIKEEKFFKDNLPDSFYYQYYENGGVRSRRSYYQGKERFERIDYNEEGKVSEYIFLNFEQTKIYARIYNRFGECIGVRGEPFFECLLLATSHFIFSTKDTVSAIFFCANPTGL